MNQAINRPSITGFLIRTTPDLRFTIDFGRVLSRFGTGIFKALETELGVR